MKFFLGAVIIAFIVHIIGSQEVPPHKFPLFDNGTTVNISLNDFSFKGQTSSRGLVRPMSTIKVVLDSSTIKNASFVIFQAHSYIFPISLSYKPNVTEGEHVNGTDVGLYSKTDPAEIIFYIYNPNNKTVEFLLVPVLYDSDDPIPGGCNLSFTVNISPYMTLSYDYTNDIVQVDAQAAAMPGKKDLCKPSILTYRMYEMSLVHTSADTYFDTVLSVVTPSGAAERGTSTRKPMHRPELRRRFAGYPEFGAVYMTTVLNPETGRSAAYVPLVKYPCSLQNCAECNTYADAEWTLAITFSICMISEICYMLGIPKPKRHFNFIRSIMILNSFLILSSAIPHLISVIFWVFLTVLFAVLVVLDACYRDNTSRRFHEGWADILLPIVPAHIFFGLFLYAGLGSLAGFQDWLIILFCFGVFIIVSILITAISRNLTECLFLSVAFIVLFSKVNGGTLMYVFIDPSRILKRDFSDVIFSPPLLLSDSSMLAVCPLMIAMWSWGRNKFRQESENADYEEIQ